MGTSTFYFRGTNNNKYVVSHFNSMTNFIRNGQTIYKCGHITKIPTDFLLFSWRNSIVSAKKLEYMHSSRQSEQNKETILIGEGRKILKKRSIFSHVLSRFSLLANEKNVSAQLMRKPSQ